MENVTYAELKRKPLVSLADGSKLGEIADLYLDSSTWTVVAASVQAKEGVSTLPWSSIKGIGPDAVTVDQADAVQPGAPDGLSFQQLCDHTVVDASGTILGEIDELGFAYPGGNVESFHVTKGGVFGLGAQVTTVLIKNVRGLGPKLVTVELPVESA